MKKIFNKKIIIIIVGVLLATIISVLTWYFTSITEIDKKNKDEIEIKIPLGSGARTIADILKDKEIIKNKTAFMIYIKLNKITNFQAGEYYLNKSMNIKELTQILQTGKVEDPNQLNITYLEGKNIRWLAKKIDELTNNTEEDVYALLEDEGYIDSLIKQYWFLTNDIKSEDIYYALEGYLFPDTYAIENKDTSVKEILKKMLNRMETVLNSYKEDIENSEYTIHELLTIASIIEMESMNDEGRKDVSSVIYNRINRNMAIQSDVTTYYAFKIDMGDRDLYQREIDQYNPYNTRGPRMEGQLPIGPISSVSKNSIDAALNPNDTEYLYFVADKNGKLYLTKNLSEHNSIISKLKSEGLWFEY